MGVKDEPDVKIIMDHFETIWTFMQQCVGQHRKIFVHCVAGMNRSPTICVAFLMRHLRRSLPKALHHLMSRRPSCIHNKSFQKELIVFAKSEGLLVRDGEVDNQLL